MHSREMGFVARATWVVICEIHTAVKTRLCMLLCFNLNYLYNFSTFEEASLELRLHASACPHLSKYQLCIWRIFHIAYFSVIKSF